MGSIVRSFTTTIAAVIAVMVLSCVAVGQVDAQQVPKLWSWTTQPPDVFSSTPITDIANLNFCPTTYHSKTIDGVSGQASVCMFEGDTTRFGVRYATGVFSHVVGMGMDSKMYGIDGPCYRYDGCTYIPSTDTMVTKQYLVSGVVRSMVIYKNFSQRIKPIVSSNGLAIVYTFDTSNPDYIYQNDSGYAIPIGGIGVSSNGKWLTVEFRQRGIGLLNLDTFEMRRIANLSFSYGYGYDASVEMTVSNDGRHVAVMGYNAGLNFFDVNPDCGELITNDNIMSAGPRSINCPQAFLLKDPFVDRFSAGLHPTFNDEGSELRFYAASYSFQHREVVMRAAGFEGRRIDYLALGDSYSSGEGETSDGHYLPGTNVPFEKCHVSDRSYPFLIALAMGIEAQYMKSVACSGAVIGDIAGSSDGYSGQSARLGVKGLRFESAQQLLAQSNAKVEFLQGRVRQFDFVSYVSPSILTIGIGGNDAGFSDKLTTCLGLDTCEWAATSKGREKTAKELQSLFPKLVDTYTALHEASPSSRIYVIGYPDLMADGQCDPLHEVLLNQNEREFFRQSVVYLNAVIAAAAQKAGVRYIDVTDSFGASALCGSAWPKAMNGLKVGDDFPNIELANWLKFIGQESFHPRPVGHQMTAELIMAQVSDLQTYEYCRDRFDRNEVVCPLVGIVAPDPGGYWLADGQTHGYESLRRMSFMDSETYSYDQVDANIALPDYSFAAGSDVQVEIHSEPHIVGTYRVGDAGSLVTDMLFPQNLEPGFHTVHILGKSYSGELIDVYQVIKKEPEHSEASVSLGNGSSDTVNKSVQGSAADIQQDDQYEDLYEKKESYAAVDSLDSEIPKFTWASKMGSSASDIFVAIGWVALLFGGAYSVYARLRRR